MLVEWNYFSRIYVGGIEQKELKYSHEFNLTGFIYIYILTENKLLNKNELVYFLFFL